MPTLEHYASAPEIEDEFTIWEQQWRSTIKDGENTQAQPPPLLPEGFDTVAFCGPSGDHDPHLMQYYMPVDKAKDPYLVKLFKTAMRKAYKAPDFPLNFLALRDERPDQIKQSQKKCHARLRELTKDFDDRLINIFFKFIYPTFPVVDQQEFLKTYKTDRSSIDIALLSGIYAISSIWWKYDKFELCQKLIPDGLYDKLYGECRNAIEQSLQYPTLGTIQGLLLLTQKNISNNIIPATFASCTDISILVSTCHRLGLHLDCTEWVIPAQEKRLRKRLWAVTYLVEKWNSANLGIPSLLSDCNTTWTIYSEPDSAGLQLFVQFVRLTRILDQVVKEFYSVKGYAARYHDYKSTIYKVETYMKKLHDWRNQLPDQLKNTDYYEADEPSKNGVLHLAEVTIAILLLRLKIHPLCTGIIDRPTAAKYRQQAWTTIQRVITYTSAIDHWHLHSFWHSMTSLNFCTLVSFFLLFKVTATSSKEHKDATDAYKKWENSLKRLAGSWDGVNLAMLKINAIYSFGKIPEDDDLECDFPNGGEKLIKYTKNTDEQNRLLKNEEMKRSQEQELAAKKQQMKAATELNQSKSQSMQKQQQPRSVQIDFPNYTNTNDSPPIPQRSSNSVMEMHSAASVSPTPILSPEARTNSFSSSGRPSGTGFDDHISSLLNNMTFPNAQSATSIPVTDSRSPSGSPYDSSTQIIGTNIRYKNQNSHERNYNIQDHMNRGIRRSDSNSSTGSTSNMIPMPMNMNMRLGMGMEMEMSVTMDMNMNVSTNGNGSRQLFHHMSAESTSAIDFNELDINDLGQEIHSYMEMGSKINMGPISGSNYENSNHINSQNNISIQEQQNHLNYNDSQYYSENHEGQGQNQNQNALSQNGFDMNSGYDSGGNADEVYWS